VAAGIKLSMLPRLSKLFDWRTMFTASVRPRRRRSAGMTNWRTGETLRILVHYRSAQRDRRLGHCVEGRRSSAAPQVHHGRRVTFAYCRTHPETVDQSHVTPRCSALE
jgi:hypothetical protein